ncbi:MAG TPA: hypothetical protein IGS17_17885 [Oscillatoriales cyanobacterium M59_W2019_021]|nr:hypothetical protein [Oscillatoriales cyanobacterium M4454_W2019_049]HIK52774.1 hypothetical protein [Oscillatoriales cyanobacterium M59_W2019_021]
MSQPSSIKSLDGSSPTPDLQPGLKVALGSVDVELEAELARYRRQSKKAQPVTPPVPSDIPEAKLQISPPPISPPSAMPESQPLPDGPAVARSGSSSTPEPESVTAGANSAAMGTATRDGAPNDYLDSSEELLRTTDEPDADAAATPKQNAWLTPLGIGSVLLFLLAAATLGYVAFNRTGGGTRQSSPAASQPEGATPDRQSGVGSSTGGEDRKMPSGPDLSSQEFVDLDLNSLSSADPSPDPIPSPIASPTSSPTASPSPAVDSLNNLNSVLAPLPTPEKSDETSADRSTPTPSPSAAESPDPEASPSSEATESEAETDAQLPDPIVNDDYYGFYFVVVDADAKVWEKAQEIVPDAYNRTFPIGDRIQMGAFEYREDAEKLVESLKEQNLSAEIYQPE